MPSWSTGSSSSKSSLESWAKADGNFGIPKFCWCGERMRVVDSHTAENRGRKIYKCPNSEDGREHLEKWWDEAIEEQMAILTMRLDDDKDASTRGLESMCVAMGSMRQEIEELKERVRDNTNQIARLKQLLGSW